MSDDSPPKSGVPGCLRLGELAVSSFGSENGVDLQIPAREVPDSPGVAFQDGPTGQRAVVEGTGLDIWEIIAAWKEDDLSFEELKDEFPWLSESQLRSSLAYYERFPQDIDARIEQEASWTPEAVWSKLPFAKPQDREPP